jgi:2-amino-4-hydroxy-6-hydroxymethyldihydropteridine diphosphokinase
MTETFVFFSIGGNLGDRLALIEETRDFIDFNIGDIVLSSSIYETSAWGMPEGTPTFYNQVLAVKTTKTLVQIKQEIDEIDEYYGRVRKGSGYENREMDVDVLFYKNEIHQEPLLVPHPKIQDRAFILTPLNEIAPDFIHPTLQLTIQHLAKACKDEGSIHRI